MEPEQWCEPPPVGVGEDALPLVPGEDVLEHERVHEHQGGLQDAQAEHDEFLLVPVVAGDVPAVAVSDHGVDAVP